MAVGSFISLGAYGSQTRTIVADGASGVCYLNTTAIPSLHRTASTMSEDLWRNPVDVYRTAGAVAQSLPTAEGTLWTNRYLSPALAG